MKDREMRMRLELLSEKVFGVKSKYKKLYEHLVQIDWSEIKDNRQNQPLYAQARLSDRQVLSLLRTENKKRIKREAKLKLIERKRKAKQEEK